MKHEVRTPEDAMVYLVDCTLATVSHMASLKSKSKSEYSRQIAIAQTGVDWISHMKIDPRKSRVMDILENNQSVQDWADAQIIP